MSNVPTDAELQARADRLGAQFVNESKLRSNIKDVQYVIVPGSQLTICVITLLNGYTVTGESACADPLMFDKDVGEKFAFAAAERKVWPLLVYAPKQEIFLNGDGTFKGRLEREARELEDKFDKLSAFIGTDTFRGLNPKERELLVTQKGAMSEYLEILKERLAL